MGPSAKEEQAGDAGPLAGGDKAGVDLRAQTPSAGSGSDVFPKDNLASDVIGRALQAHFRALTEAPLPDRFRVLLAQLEAKDSQDD